MREQRRDAADRDLLDALRRHGTHERFDADETWAAVRARRWQDADVPTVPPRRGRGGPPAVLPLAAAAAVAVLGVGPAVLATLHRGPSADRPLPAVAGSGVGGGVDRPSGEVSSGGVSSGAAGPTARPTVGTAAAVGPAAQPSGATPSGAVTGGAGPPSSTHAGGVRGTGSDAPPGAAPATRGPVPVADVAEGVRLDTDPDGPGTLDAFGPDGWAVFTGTGWEQPAAPAADVRVTVKAPARAAAEDGAYTVRWVGGDGTASGASSRRLAGPVGAPWALTLPPSGRGRTLRVHGGCVAQGLQVTVIGGGDSTPVTASWDDGPADGFVLTVVLPARSGGRTVVLEPTDGSRVAVAAVTVTVP